MGISQSDVDALIASHGDSAPTSPSTSGASGPSATVLAPAANRCAPSESDMYRILGMKLRTSVVLAERHMPLESILRITVGTILEFERAFDSELMLRVVDRPIGAGHAVKVGENFGIRVTQIRSVTDRIEAMGPES